MPIIGTLPNNIMNGQSVDANPVMADFNFIVNQVNANANPIGTLTAPSGTSTVFYQAAAPVGWTINAAVTDHTIQVSATTGGTTGGATGYSTMFSAQWTSDGHALTIAELAAHNHPAGDSGHTHFVSDPGHHHTFAGVGPVLSTSNGTLSTGVSGTGSFQNMDNALTGITNQTGFANVVISNTGSGNAHTHTKTFNSQYVAMVMAVKT